MAAWLVSVASVVGNLAVVLVLLQSSRCPMAVSKFLMVNLAVADLCMGCYLFLIVGMDVNTIGVYFNYAIDWQNGTIDSGSGRFGAPCNKDFLVGQLGK